MLSELHDYKLLAYNPRLLAFYSGWLGQKAHALAYLAVLQDRHELWTTAADEVDRLVLILHEAAKAKHLNLSGETRMALGELIGRFGDGGWWTSSEGIEERAAHRGERREHEDYPDEQLDSSGTPFQPRLALEHNVVYHVASIPIRALDAALMKSAGALSSLDVSRLGVLLAGFCYRTTPRLDVGFVNSVLKDLAAHDLTDLQAENDFRRAVGLSELAADRQPRSITDPTPMPVPSLPAGDQGTAHGGRRLLDRSFGSLGEHHDLILGCVFRRFGVAVPPCESDAARHSELPRLKQSLQERLNAQTAGEAVAGKMAPGEADRPMKNFTGQTEFWSKEAIAYLGLDRLGLARPDMALQRLIKKGALHPTKISGRLVFKREDLDRVREKGDQVRRRGRPRKDRE